MRKILIGDRAVGHGEPCFIIAEAGVNHNGDRKNARKLIDLAKAAGADAVKFQTFRAEDLVTKSAAKAEYQMKSTGAGESQFDMIKKLELGEDDFKKLASHCEKKGIMFLSSPFDVASVDLLDRIGVPAYKVASGEITNFPLLRHIAKKGRPVILSSGMSTLDEVGDAVRCLEKEGMNDIVLLHCTSNYPASPDSINLKAMETLERAFDYPAGFSDHTMGIMASVVATALGACVIEKHFTIDRTMPGPDHKASLEPAELKAMVQSIRDVEAMLGDGVKKPAREEENVRKVARKSLVASRDIKKGTRIGESMLDIKRPGTGIEPKRMDEIVGATARRDIKKDELFRWDMIR